MWGATWSTPSPQGRSQDPGAHRQSRGQGTAGVPAWLGLVHPTCEQPESSDQAHPPVKLLWSSVFGGWQGIWIPT